MKIARGLSVISARDETTARGARKSLRKERGKTVLTSAEIPMVDCRAVRGVLGSFRGL
jgi:hypothetical protein